MARLNFLLLSILLRWPHCATISDHNSSFSFLSSSLRLPRLEATSGGQSRKRPHLFGQWNNQSTDACGGRRGRTKEVEEENGTGDPTQTLPCTLSFVLQHFYGYVCLSPSRLFSLAHVFLLCLFLQGICPRLGVFWAVALAATPALRLFGTNTMGLHHWQ